MAAPSSNTGGYVMRGRFGDTTATKVFVGGLAWETPTEELRRYFEQFGDILEAVIITDKNTGRSKGYGFVTFRDPESARRSVAEPNPVIDGRRANCNIAALGRPQPAPPRVMRHPSGSIYPSPIQVTGQPYSRVAAQVPPPLPVLYPTPYGYMTYGTDYRYQQQAMYNPQMTPQYYHEVYGPSSTSNVGHPQYYPNMGYNMQTTRASYPSNSQAYHQQYMQYPTVQMQGSFTPSSHSFGFQLQAPPHARQPQSITDSQSPRQPSTNMENTDSSNA